MSSERNEEQSNKGRVLVIGVGNVGQVAIHMMAYRQDVFREIHVAARSSTNAQKIKESVEHKTKGEVTIHMHQVDASQVDDLVSLIRAVNPVLVMNLTPPYTNLDIMEACRRAGVDYLDTACYEHPDRYGFSNVPQLDQDQSFREKGIRALIQCGFDPGATNLFVAHAIQAGLFDEQGIDSVDIVDCNAGRKKDEIKWAPNFDPEINIRELVLPVKTVCDGQWLEHGRIIDDQAIHIDIAYPEAGTASSYLMYHEEIESLHRSFPWIRRLRFWMTFSLEYLTHLRVLHNVGMTGITPVDYEGHPVIPVRLLKMLLPKGESFNDTYVGKTCIGCFIHGKKNGKERTIFMYQVDDHQTAFHLSGGNAIGHTTAGPAVSAAVIMLTDKNFLPFGVHVPENVYPAQRVLDELARNGLPWQVIELDGLPDNLKQDIPGRPTLLEAL